MELIENDIQEKAALWDTLAVLREKDFHWILPFFWSEDDDGPSYLGYGLAFLCKVAGTKGLRQLLLSSAFLSVGEAIRNSQELGGHPVQWKSLFTLWLLATGRVYESVLRNEKESELLERMAILNAYYFPDQRYEALYPDITPVNSFRVLLSAYFQASLPPLHDKAYFSSWDHPLDLVDVTNDVR